MKLQILVPQYNETEDVIRPLLASLALQQQVDFSDFGVIICNDGSDVRLSDEFINSWPFKVEYHLCEHAGVSATRNACLDRATADYVMFCDADDMFYNMCGLWIIFREIAVGFDTMTSVFIEETLGPNGTHVYINREMDSTFVHGKVHRRQYLVDKSIRFNPSLTIHEDSFFNILAQACCPDPKYCVSPFYLWKWRDDSVCRHDPKYILKTYGNMIDSNTALVDEFVRRGMTDKALFHVAFMVFDAYYTMNKPEWVNQENVEYRDSVEARFKMYYEKYRAMWDSVEQRDRMMISNAIRSRVIGEGMLMEAVTIDEWLRKIESLDGKSDK